MSQSGVLRFVGILMAWIATAMIPPAALAVGEGLFFSWLACIATVGAIGGVLILATRGEVTLDHRAGLVVVGLGWLAVVIVGSLPFAYTGVSPGLAAAFFESVSGFTTTGATVFPIIEDLPRSILLWRSITHWLGGMGIIVLGVAILPFLGVGGAQIFHAEAPGITTDRLKPRIAATARLLWSVYAILTVALGMGYLVLGMPVFDAINHAMSTLATGGFSTRTTSLGAYSPAIQWLTVIFMVIAGTNFALHYRMMSGQLGTWFRDVEWRVYVLLIVVAALPCFVVLGFTDGVWSLDLFRTATFNVVAVMTTTGFATTDFAAWPPVLQVILLGLMFVGAMGGSTGGGLKVVRFVVLATHAVKRFQLVHHPRAVVVTRIGRRPIRQDVFLNVVDLFALFICTHGVGTFLLTAMGYDFMTSVSAALAAMSSIGPGLGAVGPASNYGFMNPGAMIVLSLLMLLGRLEFYTLLVLFVPETWRRAFRSNSR